jgi:hypothetical protein
MAKRATMAHYDEAPGAPESKARLSFFEWFFYPTVRQGESKVIISQKSTFKKPRFLATSSTLKKFASIVLSGTRKNENGRADISSSTPQRHWGSTNSDEILGQKQRGGTKNGKPCEFKIYHQCSLSAKESQRLQLSPGHIGNQRTPRNITSSGNWKIRSNQGSTMSSGSSRQWGESRLCAQGTMF